MCWVIVEDVKSNKVVSVAGCLGYDVLVSFLQLFCLLCFVSVAGCLGYDVLGKRKYR